MDPEVKRQVQEQIAILLRLLDTADSEPKRDYVRKLISEAEAALNVQ